MRVAELAVEGLQIDFDLVSIRLVRSGERGIVTAAGIIKSQMHLSELSTEKPVCNRGTSELYDCDLEVVRVLTTTVQNGQEVCDAASTSKWQIQMDAGILTHAKS